MVKKSDDRSICIGYRVAVRNDGSNTENVKNVLCPGLRDTWCFQPGDFLLIIAREEPHPFKARGSSTDAAIDMAGDTGLQTQLIQVIPPGIVGEEAAPEPAGATGPQTSYSSYPPDIVGEEHNGDKEFTSVGSVSSVTDWGESHD